MRVKDLISRRFGHKHRNDPIFGRMLYMGNKVRYWEGNVLFTPTERMVEVFVDGGFDDDMKPQHRFFEKVLEHWPTLSEEISKCIRGKLHDKERVSSDLWQEFRVSSLSIPNAPMEQAHWEISCVRESNNDLWTVQMIGRTSTDASVDG
jgi:hypothetical protein